MGQSGSRACSCLDSKQPSPTTQTKSKPAVSEDADCNVILPHECIQKAPMLPPADNKESPEALQSPQSTAVTLLDDSCINVTTSKAADPCVNVKDSTEDGRELLNVELLSPRSRSLRIHKEGRVPYMFAAVPLKQVSRQGGDAAQLEVRQDVTADELELLINLAYPGGGGSIPNAELFTLIGEFWNGLEALKTDALGDDELLSCKAWAAKIIEECAEHGQEVEPDNIKRACGALDRQDALRLSVVEALFHRLFETCPFLMEASQTSEQRIGDFVSSAIRRCESQRISEVGVSQAAMASYQSMQ